MTTSTNHEWSECKKSRSQGRKSHQLHARRPGILKPDPRFLRPSMSQKSTLTHNPGGIYGTAITSSIILITYYSHTTMQTINTHR